MTMSVCGNAISNWCAFIYLGPTNSWDPENLRFSDKSQKAIDLLRVKCLKLRCMVIRFVRCDCAFDCTRIPICVPSLPPKKNTRSDGRYYETVKANFERADRTTVVRTTTCCRVSAYHLLKNYSDLVFN